MAEKSCVGSPTARKNKESGSDKIDNPGLVEAINRLADAVESLRMDMHSYFSEEMPTRRAPHGNGV